MQVQNFEPISRTLRDFQDFFERLEPTLDDHPVGKKSNKTSRQEKGNKKRCQNNNNNNKDKNYFCMFHGHNLYAQHQTVPHLKKGGQKAQKNCESGNR